MVENIKDPTILTFPKTQKAKIYIRVSTEDQVREGFSLEAQRKHLEEFARGKGYELSGIYKDAGFSGKDTDRPALQQMLLDAKEGLFDILVTLSPDRLSRNIIDQAIIRDILDKNGVELKFLTLPVDTTTPEGDLITNIIGSVSQYERRLISRRVKIGMCQKAQEGGFNGMSAPFGYDIVNGELMVRKEEAEVVKRIFKMKEEGMTLESITNLLSEFNVPTKRGGAWSKKQVWRILHSAIVRGYLHWDGITVKGIHTPIITEEMNDTTSFPLTAENLPINQKGENNG
jgi:DNA invertase Pin-like site-specific DNA recombinase